MTLSYSVAIEYGKHYLYADKQFRINEGSISVITDLEKHILRTDLSSWLHEMCEGDWTFQYVPEPFHGPNTTIKFELEADAVLFKTTWC